MSTEVGAEVGAFVDAAHEVADAIVNKPEGHDEQFSAYALEYLPAAQAVMVEEPDGQ